MIRLKLIAATSLAVLIMPVAPALARDGSGDTTGSTSGSTTSTTTETETHSGTSGTSTRSGDTKKTIADVESKESNKSEANKQKACQNREVSINKRMQNIAARGQKQLDVFTTIANRAETFYSDNNLSLSNYTTLVANVNAQKAAAQSTVDQIKADSVSFSCTGSDPKAALTAFKTDLNSEISALKSYRTAVKNLIVGVKSVAPSTEGHNNG